MYDVSYLSPEYTMVIWLLYCCYHSKVPQEAYRIGAQQSVAISRGNAEVAHKH